MIENYAQELKFHIPEELRQYVFAVIKGETESAVQTTFPIHPTGFPLLVSVYNDAPIVRIHGERSHIAPRLSVNGQIDKDDIALEINGKFGQVALVLSPTATYYLFHKPGIHFSNLCQSFDEVTPTSSQGLVGELAHCKLPEEHLPILLEIVRHLSKTRLPPIEWLDTSITRILSKDGKVTQTELAEQSGVGVRHFRRKFKEVVGIGPKYFCKIIQLNTIFERLKSAEQDQLHQLALDCGYYDQAHFINDFNRLIGSSPTHFLKGKHAFVQSYLGRKEFRT